MKKKIVSWLIAASMLISVMPVSFAENTQTDEMLNIQEEVLTSENSDDNTEEIVNALKESPSEDVELFSDDIQVFANFTPRTSAPDLSDYWYKSGVNPLRSFWSNGNCTWYAWGRASEIKGSAVSSWAFRHNACTWWSENQSNNIYPSGQTPAVGAIAVWGGCSTNGAGHVAIVEAVNGDYVTISESSYGGVWYTGSYWGTKTYTLSQLKTAISYQKVVMPFLGFIYVNGSGGETQVHTHSWSYANESAHPHREYRYCSCGAKEYTGNTQRVSSCTSCYPLGNVSLTRSFVRTEKNAAFYRNSVSNANSYTLTLYRNGVIYNTYNMNSTTYTVSGLSSGTYTATLTARNTSTGQSKSASCSSFTLVDTYPVTYNANGGTNAPSAQTKIKDENMTITSQIPKRAHYIFKGWASSKTATEAQYEAGGTYTKNTPITLYAVWEPETYTIDFDTNGGKGEAESTTITYGNSMKMPNSIVKDSYYLKGWSKTKNVSVADYKIGIDYQLEENMTLYAVWGNSTWGGSVAAEFAGGDGTKENPYQISNASELAHLADKVNQQTAAPEYEYYILTDNINLGHEEWTPIGLHDYESQYFCGSFDGNGYTISDLYISGENSGYIGLFGYTKDSEIKNLNVSGDVEGLSLSDTSYISAVTGYADNTDINGCTTMYANISDISNSSSEYSYIGTICGYIDNGNITECTANRCYIGMKDGYSYTGIISGYIKGNINDSNVKSEDELFGSTSETDNVYLGGVCGKLEGNAEKCTVSAGFFSNTLKTAAAYIGGIAGYLEGNIDLCTAQFDNGLTKTIDSASYASSIYAESNSESRTGGIVGYAAKNGRVTNCKYDGQSISSISTGGLTDVGGIAGDVYGNELTKISAAGGQSLSYSSLPTRSGYTATWYTDANLTNEYDFSQPVMADMTLYAKWNEGETKQEIWDGTSSEPAYNADTKTYTVTNGQELAWISDVTNNKITSGTNFPTDKTFSGYTIELANDIYLNDISDVDKWETVPPANSWKPIGSNTYCFKGDFDGNNHCVFGLYCVVDNSYWGAGLFLNAVDNKIFDLGVKYGYISSSAYPAGGIVSQCSNYVTIDNCYNTNTTIVSTGGYAGGIVGDSVDYDLISNCYNKANVKGEYAGGIAGRGGGKISNCYNSGIVNGDNYAGGITSIAYDTQNYATMNTLEISNCYNDNSIFGGAYCGGIVGWGRCNINYCYNIGSISSSSSYCGGIAGALHGVTKYVTGGVGFVQFTGSVKYSYSTTSNLYNWYESDVADLYTITSVSYKSSTAMKTLSNLSGFSSTYWAVDSSINDGYPYLKSLEDSYKTYNVTVIEDPENSAVLNKCFANVDGILYSNSSSRAAAGGIIGYAGLSSSVGTAPANSLLAIVNKVSTVSSSGSNKAQSGDIIGSLNFNALEFNSAYSYSSMEKSAVNSADSSKYEIAETGTQRTLTNIKRESFLKTVFGPDTYQSLDYLAEHPDAVWVVKDGELPELYYNVLNDITVSEVENGTISVDKTQAVDGENVTVTATPAENYQLNKIYVNGIEIVGDTFEVEGDSDIYATFTEKTPEYKVTVTAADNANASVINADDLSFDSMSLFAADDSLTAKDGEEIKVNTQASEDYTVDAVYVNGEELASDSFIITADSVVTMDVTSISTEIKAVTNDATDIGNYFATLSGSIEGDAETTEKYIRYWAADTPDEVYTTEVESGSGDYSVEVTNLIPETTYYYQMTETGEIKSFVTDGYYMFAPDDDDNPTDPPVDPVTPSPEPVEPRAICFEIQNAQIADDKVTADVANISDSAQSGTLIFAAYTDEGVLVTAESKEIENLEATSSLSCEFTLPIGASKYTLFVWDSISDMIPLAESVKVE